MSVELKGFTRRRPEKSTSDAPFQLREDRGADEMEGW